MALIPGAPHISTTKTIYSYEISFGVFTFVEFKRLLELETGVTRNEPAQLCVREAIEAAVIAMTVQGLKDKLWVLENEKDWESPIIQAYLKANAEYGLLPEDTVPPAPKKQEDIHPLFESHG